MTTTITSRIGSSPSADTTKRVATTGAIPASGAGYGGSAWGGTWGDAWGKTWHSISVGSGAIAASPATDITPRIGSAPTANNTKRVTL